MPRVYLFVLIVVVLVLITVVGSLYWVTRFHRPEDLWIASGIVERARKLNLRDIEKVVIMLDDSDAVVLKPNEDSNEISRLLIAIQRIKVAKSEVTVNSTDFIRLYAPEKGGITIYGDFDPSKVPIISPSMRSNDLSRIIQDIIRQKGKSSIQQPLK